MNRIQFYEPNTDEQDTTEDGSSKAGHESFATSGCRYVNSLQDAFPDIELRVQIPPKYLVRHQQVIWTGRKYFGH